MLFTHQTIMKKFSYQDFFIFVFSRRHFRHCHIDILKNLEIHNKIKQDVTFFYTPFNRALHNYHIL